MKIVIDADILNHDNRTGVYNYNQRLFGALLKEPEPHSYTLAYFGQHKSLAELGLPGVRAAVKAASWLPRKIFHASQRTPLALPFDLCAGVRGDVFVFTKFVRWPLLWPAKSVVVIYDTAYLDYPDIIENWHFQKYLQWSVPKGIQRATKVITISESTKASLMQHYRLSAEKIALVSPALDHEMFRPAKPEQIEAVRAKFAITKPYILSVSTLEPRKNLVGLLRACAALPEEILNAHQLVLAGGKGWHDAELNRLMDELSEHMQIIRPGFVDEADLPALYSGAGVFAFPSLYEGFGMPVLEAMACGTPVVTSNNSSLPEVVGDAGLMVDATNQASLTAALAQVLTDKPLSERLRRAGLARAKRYTWEKSATLLKDVLESLNESEARA